jgi:hypothetical protein
MPEVSSTVYGPGGITSSTSKCLRRKPTQTQTVKEKLSTCKFANQESITIEDSVKEVLPIWLKPCKETLAILEFHGFTLIRNVDNFLSACPSIKKLIFTNVTLLGSEFDNSKIKLILKRRPLVNLKQVEINGEGQLSVHELNVIDNLSQNYETALVQMLFAQRAGKKRRKSQKESHLIASNVLINFLLKNSSSIKSLEIDRNPMELYEDNLDTATLCKIQLENFTGKGPGFRRILSTQFLLKSVSLIIREQDQDLFSNLVRNCSKTLRMVELSQKYSKTLKRDQKGKRASGVVYHDCGIYEPAEELEFLSLTLSEPRSMIQGRLINCHKLPRSLKKIIWHCDGFDREQNDVFIQALPSFLLLESLSIHSRINNTLPPFIVNPDLIQHLLELPKISEFLLRGCKVEEIDRIRALIESRFSFSFTTITANSCAFRK